MNKEEIFNIFYGKETWNIWRKFQEIESSIDESEFYINILMILKKCCLMKNHILKCEDLELYANYLNGIKKNKINNIIDSLLQVLDDEKPTIVRLCLSSLNNLLLYKIDLSEKVESKLKNMDLSKYKDSMKPLIQKDIDCILNQL